MIKTQFFDKKQQKNIKKYMEKYCSTLYFELVPLYATIVIQGK